MATRISDEERARRRRKKKILRAIVKTTICTLIVLLAVLLVFGVFTIVKNIKNKSDKDVNSQNTTNITNITDIDNVTEQIQTSGEENQTETNKTDSVDTSNSAVITHEDPSVYAEFMNSGHTVNVTVGSYDQYSRDYIPYGFGAKFDDKNRPEGCGYYTTKYAKYGADYIMPDSKYIFLTMDNGYEAGTTADILDTLKEKNVPCVFFLTKPYCQNEPELVRRMIDEGHVIGNHTTTHPSGGIQAYSADKMYSDIKECSDYLEQNFGYKPYLFRFPEGSCSEQALAIVQSLNMRSVFWSYAYKDWVLDAQPDVNTSLKNALDRVHGGEIILLHAESRTNADMLADFIDGVREKGFEFAFYSKVD